jgi:hypothetical protein
MEGKIDFRELIMVDFKLNLLIGFISLKNSENELKL